MPVPTALLPEVPLKISQGGLPAIVASSTQAEEVASIIRLPSANDGALAGEDGWEDAESLQLMPGKFVSGVK